MDLEIIRAGLLALKPPPIIRPSEFAEREIRLPPSSNAIPGPLRLSTFQREIVDSILDDDVETIVIMLASQIGKSLAVESQILSMIATAPGPMLHVSPDTAAAEKFVRTRLDPLIASSPLVRTLVGKGNSPRKGSTGGTNSLSSKTFPGGSLHFVSSFQPSELASMSIRFLWMDEVDRFSQSAGREGDPVLLAYQRTEKWALSGRKIVLVSTPAGRDSRIAKWFERSDKRRFYVDCPHPECGHSGPIAFEDLHYEKGRPETAELRCPGCGALHSEAQRARMLASGRWVPTAKGERGIRGYHMTALASEHMSLESLAKSWEGVTSAEEKQVFYNVKLGEPFDSAIEYSISSLELRQRAEPIRPPFSSDIEFVTAGVDVQDDRLEVQFIAHHPDGITTILNHDILEGDTYLKPVWEKLDTALGQTFELADRRKLPIYVTGIDGGHRPDPVIEFVFQQLRKHRNVVAVRGMAGFHRPFINKGGTLKKRLGFYIVGVDSVKSSLYGRFKRLEYGPGFIHIPDHLPDSFYEGLASETLETVYVNGFPRRRFVPIIRKNEALDAGVYGHAVAGLVNRRLLNKPALAPKPFDAKKFAENVAKLNGG